MFLTILKEIKEHVSNMSEGFKASSLAPVNYRHLLSKNIKGIIRPFSKSSELFSGKGKQSRLTA